MEISAITLGTIYEDVAELQSKVAELQAATADSGWLDLTLINGVIAYSEAQKPRYRRVGKTLFLSGVYKGVTANNTVIAYLPEGFRPSKRVMLPAVSVGQIFSRISVDTDGKITHERSTIEPIVAENYHSLSGSICVD